MEQYFTATFVNVSYSVQFSKLQNSEKSHPCIQDKLVQLHSAMFKSSVLLTLLVTCSVHGNVSASTNGHNEFYISNLDLIINMLEKEKYNLPKPPEDYTSKALDCADIFQMGSNKSGIYEIWPVNRLTDGKKSLNVYCDMDTDGGGWTVIQRRGDFQSPIDYFYQDWKSYKEGFGDKEKDFWIGNDNIFALTNQKLYSVRFDLKDVEQNKTYALYQEFWIDDEEHNYALHILDYSGDAGDSMIVHNNQAFSTKDKDNDRAEVGNCAVGFKGGWWYNDCHYVNLNGLYLKGKHRKEGVGVNWNDFKGRKESLEWTEIKIRPKDFRASFT